MVSGMPSRALVRPGTCRRVGTWISDTATVYTLGVTRAGLATALLGVMAMVCGGSLMALNHNNVWAGIGVWTGTPIFICGMTCVAFRRKRPTSMCSANNILCVIGVFSSTILMVTCIINVCGLAADPERFYPDYKYHIHHSKLPLFVLNGMLLVLAPLQFLFLMWLFAITMSYVCPCFSSSQGQVYTIHCDGEPDEAFDPDRETEMAMDHFAAGMDTDRILKIETDWLQKLPEASGSPQPSR